MKPWDPGGVCNSLSFCQFYFQELLIRQTRILHSVLLVMESFLFGMFVIAIGCDQFEAILSGSILYIYTSSMCFRTSLSTRLAFFTPSCSVWSPSCSGCLSSQLLATSWPAYSQVYSMCHVIYVTLLDVNVKTYTRTILGSQNFRIFRFSTQLWVQIMALFFNPMLLIFIDVL